MFLVAAAIAAVMAGVGIAAFLNLLAAREELVDELDPALATSETYYSAAQAQQNTLRGLLLTSSPVFVENHGTALEEAQAAAERLEVLLADYPDLLERFRSIHADATAWREEFVVPELALLERGEEVDRTVVERSEAVFSALRADLAEFRTAVNAERDTARRQLNDATRDLATALGVTAVTVVALAVLARVALRRWVTDPLVDLVRDAERIRSGELDHHVSPGGPPEVEELGRAMEEMRLRLREELAQVEAARAGLEETADELARSNRDLEQFAYVASHDLQEPLRKIISFCQLLQQRYGGQLDERADQYIEFAVDGARRMQVLINDLLSFSRVGRLSGDFEVVDLATCAQRALQNLEAVVEETGAVVEVGDLPTVEVEPNLMSAVFQNLIGNAIKFRTAGEAPRIAIDAAPGEEGTWEIVVSDNGIGIEPQYADRVFVIFQRLHTKDAYQGTGIGLALCRRIIEHHGGDIWVDTAVDTGTIIRFRLPERQPEHDLRPAVPAVGDDPTSESSST